MSFKITSSRHLIEIHLRFNEGYPGNLDETRDQIKVQFGLKNKPAIKNLLGGCDVVLVGECDDEYECKNIHTHVTPHENKAPHNYKSTSPQ